MSKIIIKRSHVHNGVDLPVNKEFEAKEFGFNHDELVQRLKDGETPFEVIESKDAPKKEDKK